MKPSIVVGFTRSKGGIYYKQKFKSLFSDIILYLYACLGEYIY
jgi:hypothetical protein